MWESHVLVTYEGIVGPWLGLWMHMRQVVRLPLCLLHTVFFETLTTNRHDSATTGILIPEMKQKKTYSDTAGCLPQGKSPQPDAAGKFCVRMQGSSYLVAYSTTTLIAKDRK